MNRVSFSEMRATTWLMAVPFLLGCPPDPQPQPPPTPTMTTTSTTTATATGSDTPPAPPPGKDTYQGIAW